MDEATGPPPAPAARRDGAACPRGVAGPPGAPGPADSGCSRPVQRAYCGQCSERIWGLARQGYRCINCKLLVHKRCHVLVPLSCDRHMVSGGRHSLRGCPHCPGALGLLLSRRGPDIVPATREREEGAPVGCRVTAQASGPGRALFLSPGSPRHSWGPQGPPVGSLLDCDVSRGTRSWGLTAADA